MKKDKTNDLREQLKYCLLTYGVGNMKSVIDSMEKWILHPPSKGPISIICEDKEIGQLAFDVLDAHGIYAEIIDPRLKPDYKIYTKLEIPARYKRLIDLPLITDFIFSEACSKKKKGFYIELTDLHLASYFFLLHKYDSPSGIETPAMTYGEFKAFINTFIDQGIFRYSLNILNEYAIEVYDEGYLRRNRKVEFNLYYKDYSQDLICLLRLFGSIADGKQLYIFADKLKEIPRDYYLEDHLIEKERRLKPKQVRIGNSLLIDNPCAITNTNLILSGDFRHFLQPNKQPNYWKRQFKKGKLFDNWAKKSFPSTELQTHFLKLLRISPFNKIISANELRQIQPIVNIYERRISARHELTKQNKAEGISKPTLNVNPRNYWVTIDGERINCPPRVVKSLLYILENGQRNNTAPNEGIIFNRLMLCTNLNISTKTTIRDIFKRTSFWDSEPDARLIQKYRDPLKGKSTNLYILKIDSINSKID